MSWWPAIFWMCYSRFFSTNRCQFSFVLSHTQHQKKVSQDIVMMCVVPRILADRCYMDLMVITIPLCKLKEMLGSNTPFIYDRSQSQLIAFLTTVTGKWVHKISVTPSTHTYINLYKKTIKMFNSFFFKVKAITNYMKRRLDQIICFVEIITKTNTTAVKKWFNCLIIICVYLLMLYTHQW